MCNDLPEAEPGFVIFGRDSECDGVDDDRLLCCPAVFWIRDQCMVDVCKLFNIDVLHRKLTSRGLHEGQQDQGVQYFLI